MPCFLYQIVWGKIYYHCGLYQREVEAIVDKVQHNEDMDVCGGDEILEGIKEW